MSLPPPGSDFSRLSLSASRMQQALRAVVALDEGGPPAARAAVDAAMAAGWIGAAGDRLNAAGRRIAPAARAFLAWDEGGRRPSPLLLALGRERFAGRSVLVVGAGFGADLWALDKAGVERAAGVEADPFVAELGAGLFAALGSERAELQAGQPSAVPHPRESFDVAVLHIGDEGVLEETAAEMSRVLRSEGELYVGAPRRQARAVEAALRRHGFVATRAREVRLPGRVVLRARRGTLPLAPTRPLIRPWAPPAKELKHHLRDVGAQVLWRLGKTRPEVGAHSLTIVTFHRFLPPAFRDRSPWPELAVTPPTLRRMLAHFGTWYRCLPLSEALAAFEAGDADRPLLAITVDDAQHDNFRYARPLLREAGLRATFYVPTGAVDEGRLLWHDRLGFGLQAARERALSTRPLAELLGVGPEALPSASEIIERTKKLDHDRRQEVVALVDRWLEGTPAPDWSRLMTWDEIRTLADEGHEIGGHSQSHALLPALDDEALARELAGCKARLEEELGREVSTFAYPNGDVDTRVAAATRRAGFAHAVTTRPGKNPPDADRYRLRRYDLQEELNYGALGRLDHAVLGWRLARPASPRNP